MLKHWVSLEGFYEIIQEGKELIQIGIDKVYLVKEYFNEYPMAFLLIGFVVFVGIISWILSKDSGQKNKPKEVIVRHVHEYQNNNGNIVQERDFYR